MNKINKLRNLAVFIILKSDFESRHSEMTQKTRHSELDSESL